MRVEVEVEGLLPIHFVQIACKMYKYIHVYIYINITYHFSSFCVVSQLFQLLPPPELKRKRKPKSKSKFKPKGTDNCDYL